MTTDSSAFREADILAVYGMRQICAHTAKLGGQDNQPVDAHHILGRGAKEEAKRLAHSSIFNLIFLRRDIHTGPLRDDPDQRKVYLKIAHRNVTFAIGRGEYRMQKQDSLFFDLYPPFA